MSLKYRGLRMKPLVYSDFEERYRRPPTNSKPQSARIPRQLFPPEAIRRPSVVALDNGVSLHGPYHPKAPSRAALRRDDDDINVEMEKELELESLLSRREANGYYPPPYGRQPPASSVRTSMSEVPWKEYAKSRRLIYEKNPEDPVSYMREGRMRKEMSNDKICTFYRHFESLEPELRIVVSDLRFRNLAEFIDEISRIISLRVRERYIHTPRGDIVRNLSELQDGAIYFFGPAYVYEVSEYDRFRRRLTPDLIESDMESFDDKPKASQNYRRPYEYLPRRSRKVIITSNTAAVQQFTLIIDEFRHNTMMSVLNECTYMLCSNGGTVEKLCTHHGRVITHIDDLYYSQDEEFVAIISYYNAPGNLNPRLASANARKKEKKQQRRMIYDNMEPRPPPPGSKRTGSRTPRARQMEDDKENVEETAPSPRRNRTLSESGADKPVQRKQIMRNDPRPSPSSEIVVQGKSIRFDTPSRVFYETPPSSPAPLQHMELDWIYGYNGRNCRNNTFVLPSDEVVYFVAKIVVMYNMETNQQRFYAEHSEEIRCIAQHPNSWVFATGQVSGGVAGHVRVWDSKLLFTRNVISFDDVMLSVECLAFSMADNGAFLATITTSKEEEWVLNVVQDPIPEENDDEEDVKIISSEPYHDMELSLMFDPADSSILVSCGKYHVFFWNIYGDSAEYEVGHFSGYQIPEYVTCIGFTQKSELVSADSSGFVHLWEKESKRTNTIIKTNHTGSVISMQVMTGGLIITGGGSDRLVTLMDCDQVIPTLNQFQLPERCGGIVSITPIMSGFVGTDLANLPLVLGTSGNSLLSGSFNTDFQCFIRGPSNQNTAVAKHPNDIEFLTAGEDGHVTLWRTEEHEEIWDTNIGASCSAAAFHPKGRIIAIGTTNGRWWILDSDGNHIATFRSDRSPVTCLSYSPYGKFLAVGSEAGKIFMYRCWDDGQTYRYMNCTQNPLDEITSIDWTDNGAFFRFTTASFDVDYWNVDKITCENRRMTIRDLTFKQQCGVFSYETMGIWSCVDSDVIYTAANRSNNGQLFVTGTNDGNIRLFHFPCDALTPLYNEVNIHNEALQSVFFTASDRFILTSGRKDFCLAQWKLVEGKADKSEDGGSPEQQKDGSKRPKSSEKSECGSRPVSAKEDQEQNQRSIRSAQEYLIMKTEDN